MKKSDVIRCPVANEQLMREKNPNVNTIQFVGDYFFLKKKKDTCDYFYILKK
jgi:hypothetical protein